MQPRHLCRPFIAALAMALLPMGTAGASIADTSVSATYASCQAAAHGAVDQAACISAEARLQDQRLDAVYASLLERLDGAGRARLQAAQHAWLESRRRDGELEARLYDDSQVGNLQGADAELRRVALRADQLQDYLDLLD